MIERSPLGVRLWRLLSSRRPNLETSVEYQAAALARVADVPSAELNAVIEGAEPSPETIRKLASALGIHTADMFVIGGLTVPADLASAWPTKPWDVSSIVRSAVQMDSQQRNRLDHLVRSLPVQLRTEPTPADYYPDGPGALMLRLLKNRNVNPHNARRILWEVTDGPYASASTVAMLGPGKTVMTPQYVTAFAHLLGYTPQDLVALTGVGPVIDDVAVHPASAEIAALAWNARLLSSEQIAHVVQAASQAPAPPAMRD